MGSLLLESEALPSEGCGKRPPPTRPWTRKVSDFSDDGSTWDFDSMSCAQEHHSVVSSPAGWPRIAQPAQQDSPRRLPGAVAPSAPGGSSSSRSAGAPASGLAAPWGTVRGRSPTCSGSFFREASPQTIARLYPGLLSPERCEEGCLELLLAATKTDSQVSRAAVQFALKQVIDCIKFGNPATQSQSVLALTHLARQDLDYRERVVEAGAIPLLVDLLDPRTGTLQEQAAHALTYLAKHTPKHRSLIASAGAIPALADLLPPPSPLRVRIAVADALLHLARNSLSNKAMIVLAGSIPSLIGLLAEESSEEASEVARAALGCLGASCTSHEERIRQAAVVAGYPLERLNLNLTEEPVTLHIYDVSSDSRVQRVNDLFRPVGTGVFHAGVEVFGIEYSYGHRDDRGTGVFTCEPRDNPYHTYREAVPMDVTTLSMREVHDIVLKMEKAWRGRDYHLISQNCCHFCNELFEALGVGQMPGWVTNLARTGASLVSGVQTVAAAAEAMRQEVVREVDNQFQVCEFAETAVCGTLGVQRRGALENARTLGRSEPFESEQLTPGKRSRRLFGLCAADNFGLGKLAQQLMPGLLSQDASPAKGAPGSFVDVMLECVHSDGTDLAALSRWQRSIGKRIQEGERWPIGLSHQPDTFRHLVPDASKLPQEHQEYDVLFEIAWQPPCLYLRKPVAETPLLVNGTHVRQLTYVLLQNVEIELFDPGRGATCLTFRILRDAIAKQAMYGDPVAQDATASHARQGDDPSLGPHGKCRPMHGVPESGTLRRNFPT